MARQMAQADPRRASEDAIVVDLVYGYDIGIATGWKSHRYTFGPDPSR